MLLAKHLHEGPFENVKARKRWVARSVATCTHARMPVRDALYTATGVPNRRGPSITAGGRAPSANFRQHVPLACGGTSLLRPSSWRTRASANAGPRSPRTSVRRPYGQRWLGQAAKQRWESRQDSVRMIFQVSAKCLGYKYCSMEGREVVVRQVK